MPIGDEARFEADEVKRIGRGRQAVEMSRIEARNANGDESRIVYDSAQNVVHGAASSITLEQCGAIAMPSGPLTLEFLTQTRLKHEGRFVRRPEFQILFRRLLGRLSSLARFHRGAPLEVDFRA